ncbi:MAG: hypothetical protein UZ01_00967 [Candidatus Brocadia sinica]|uniref:hypothetical protein n=1 Tax=Candidatus Brocadiaceae TaxID=1127830 RepID=UPI0007944F32|nr:MULTISPECIES: hypothetical protein [Candidatus Brocadiaceae]KXK31254.1 MAG: hypothetical protein UZ01_00967 [Candidatus Brocadia sinica]MCK6469919.1 hypothetical protein [Candidatus Brocadia sinica]NOG43099.1 hypothetical protein [Planctomycetota bacterium]NUO06156.1 hypothetical protein [Candidatus Brocadia sinica]
MKKTIFVWSYLLFIIFPIQIFAGDVVITVDRFKQNNDVPVRFSICDREECHQE